MIESDSGCLQRVAASARHGTLPGPAGAGAGENIRYTMTAVFILML